MPQLGRDARGEFARRTFRGRCSRRRRGRGYRTRAAHAAESREVRAGNRALGSATVTRCRLRRCAGGSAARVWWTFRAFGTITWRCSTAGLRKWRAEGRAVESGTPSPIVGDSPRGCGRRSYATSMPYASTSPTRAEQVIDARSRGRFAGDRARPRAGLRGGHIPGSLNLPYDELYVRTERCVPSRATATPSPRPGSIPRVRDHELRLRRHRIGAGSRPSRPRPSRCRRLRRPLSEWGAHPDTRRPA